MASLQETATLDLSAWAHEVGIAGRSTVTVTEAAALIGVSERNLRGQIADGAFPHQRIGRRIVIPVPMLMHWMTGAKSA